ncbi:hypothetical protein FBU59_005715 [Linderina macrospora]|uniref:Uncharacterized protein n=1 Tax=Linderina macrospora TaxID=4868 RepID=A0ACC1J205_9FUNG|nr:hypothetical protein FBU59_005715 [Linderina macrospora]
MLVRHYRKQLACIQGLYPLLPSVISSVASETADLILSAAYLDRYEEHPLFEASVVQRLSIYNIANGVNWKWFKAKKDNEIVFSSLERARFYFVERAHRKVKPDPTGGFVLRFPVLYLLMVGDSAPYYGDFYALFHQSPITTLAMGEDLKDFPLIDVRIFANVRMLDLIAGPYADVPTKLSTGTVTHFYSAMRKVQDAYIIGNPFPLTAIEQLAEVLTMTIQLEENQVPHLRAAIRQLPKLKRLDVAYRRYQREGKRAYGWELTEEEQVADDYPHLPGWFVRDFRETSDLPTISTQLHTLRIEQRSCETIRQTCFFIRSLPNLRKVAVARAHMHNIGDLNTERGRGVITEVYER